MAGASEGSFGVPPIKVILDTDIGSDIDDAVALAYLLANPDCELLGITTVSGQAAERAKMCSAMCRAAGVDVPIYPGLERPLLIESLQKDCPQAAALARWPHASSFPAGQAVRFLAQTIRAHPREVVLLAIGPLTNIGALFASDPEIPSLLKALVLMGGRFFNRLADLPAVEWNAMNDPHAAAIVYRARPPVHRSIGLDVTRQVTMDREQVRARFAAHRQLAIVADFAEIWFSQARERLTFHDPLAATTIFDEGICTFQRGEVRVELLSPDLAGTTLWRSDPSGPHEAAAAVEPRRFFEHYFAAFQTD